MAGDTPVSKIDAADLLHYDDLVASTVAIVFSKIYSTGQNPYMSAVQALVISAISRIISKWAMDGKMTSLTQNGKNQIVVALANAGVALLTKRGVMKSIATGVSIDLIATELLVIGKFEPDASPFKVASTDDANTL